MALLALVVLGAVGGIVLWLLRENRHRFHEPQYPDPSRDEDAKR